VQESQTNLQPLFPNTQALSMHCDRCNIDFPEGLRYCKWCGDPLVDRPRVTSELHACPSCSAAVQPAWTYCKTCGEPLRAAAGRTPAKAPERAAQSAQDSIDTMVIGKCSSCGERLDTGSLYCKACGSAAYDPQVSSGASALLCAVCNSYSKLGSRVCRVCGSPFIQAAETVVDMPVPSVPIQRNSDTLRDLERQPSSEDVATRLHQTPDFDSHAKAVDTSYLPGTAGSKSEQQVPTSELQMGRSTGPVDEATSPAEPTQEPAPPVIESTQSFGEAKASDVDARIASELPASSMREATLGFGSESVGQTPASESKTEVFVSPHAPQRPPKGSQDEMRTRQFVTDQRSEIQATREFQSPANTISAEVATRTTSTQPARSEFAPSRPVPETTAVPIPQVPSAAPVKKRSGNVLASVIVALIVIGGAIYAGWWFLFSHGRPAPQPTPPARVEQPPVTPEPRVTPPTTPVVPEGMVAVAAGSYAIGRDGADPLEQPRHVVDLAAFDIDRTEVTNAAYKKFVDATGHKPPTNWTGGSYPEGRDNFPVTGVSWQDAADYAAWAGKRLPTETEWEAAARGADGRIYPWGNEFRAAAANIGVTPDKPGPEQYPKGIKEVGRYPEGASPTGAVDMIGNVWEWVADEIKPYPGNTESKLDLEKNVTYRVIRGGAYDGNKSHDATYRGYLDASKAYPKVGFRCAKDAK
jgi:formylglycine-generating enzyme required for sulfatase activity